MTACGDDGEDILWASETGPLVQGDFLLELDVTGWIAMYTRFYSSKRDYEGFSG